MKCQVAGKSGFNVEYFDVRWFIYGVFLADEITYSHEVKRFTCDCHLCRRDNCHVRIRFGIGSNIERRFMALKIFSGIKWANCSYDRYKNQGEIIEGVTHLNSEKHPPPWARKT